MSFDKLAQAVAQAVAHGAGKPIMFAGATGLVIP